MIFPYKKGLPSQWNYTAKNEKSSQRKKQKSEEYEIRKLHTIVIGER